jgi:hypothetical protein
MAIMATGTGGEGQANERDLETKNGRQNATKRTPEGMLGLIEVCNSLSYLVGPPGFEPGTSCTPSNINQSLTDSAY